MREMQNFTSKGYFFLLKLKVLRKIVVPLRSEYSINMVTMNKKCYEPPSTLVLTLKTQHQILVESDRMVNSVESDSGLGYGGKGTDIEARGRENVWED